MMDYNTYRNYYKEKARDLPKYPPLPNAVELNRLDDLTALALEGAATWNEVDRAMEAVLEHPHNTYTREVLEYRQRQLFFK